MRSRSTNIMLLFVISCISATPTCNDIKVAYGLSQCCEAQNPTTDAATCFVNTDAAFALQKRPIHPPITGPLKLVKNTTVTSHPTLGNRSVGDLVTLSELYTLGTPLSHLMMQGAGDQAFGIDTRLVSVSTGTVSYVKNGDVKTFTGTVDMSQNDLFDWWAAVRAWSEAMIPSPPPGIRPSIQTTITSLDDLIIHNTELGTRGGRDLNHWTEIAGGFRAFDDTQNLKKSVAFYKLPVQDYEFRFTVTHNADMPSSGGLNRPTDTGLFFDITHPDEIGRDPYDLDDLMLKGYQIFNFNHGLGPAIIGYPYGSPDWSWFSAPVSGVVPAIGATESYSVRLVKRGYVMNAYVTPSGTGVESHVWVDFQSKYVGGFVGLQYEACKVDYTDISIRPAP